MSPSISAQNAGRSSPVRGTARQVVVLLAVLAVGLFVAFVFRSKPAPDQSNATVREAPRSESTLRDGRLYRAGDTNAFSGVMIERFAEGALRSRLAVFEGLLHGVSEGWCTNRQLQVTENFKQGISHGLRTKWHLSGTKLSEAKIVESKFDGLFRNGTRTGSSSSKSNSSTNNLIASRWPASSAAT